MGKGKSHKGASRHFTSAEEIQRQQADLHRQKKDESESESDSSESEDGDEARPSKGRPTIAVHNPNLVAQKMKKTVDIDEETGGKPQLNRKEKEAIEAVRRQREYQRRHEAGLTDEAQADLARLAIIRKERADAAAKREAEKKAKDEAATSARLANPGVKSAPKVEAKTGKKK